MNTILRILERAGGLRPDLHLRIYNPPYLPLVIDSLETTGPMGRPSTRVAHLSYSNGRLMAHPEMRFEFDDSTEAAVGLDPYYWRNDYVGIEELSRFLQNGRQLSEPVMHQRQIRFAVEWDRVLTGQRTVEAYIRSLGCP